MSLKDLLLAIYVAFAWGSYFTVSKLVLVSFPPLLFAATRFFLLFLLTLPFFFKAELPIKKIFLLSIATFFSILFINNSIHLSSNLAPIILINEMSAPISSLFGVCFLKERFSPKDIIGIFLAIIGVVIVIQMRSVEDVSLIAVIMALFAAIAFACYNVIAKEISNVKILPLLCYISLFSFPQFLVASFFQETWPTIQELDLKSIYALLYIVIAATLMTHYIWFYLLNKYPMSKIAPFTLLSPLFGCITTAVILHETIKINVLFGGGLIMVGIAMIEFGNFCHQQKYPQNNNN